MAVNFNFSIDRNRFIEFFEFYASSYVYKRFHDEFSCLVAGQYLPVNVDQERRKEGEKFSRELCTFLGYITVMHPRFVLLFVEKKEWPYIRLRII